jgi:hypothetical protein
MRQKAMAISIAVSFILGVAIFVIALLTKDTQYSEAVILATGILTTILFLFYIFFNILAQLVSLICKKYLLTKEIAVSFLIYLGIYAITLSFYPHFIDDMLKKWDFRFAAFGLALISFAMAMLPKDSQDAEH